MRAVTVDGDSERRLAATTHGFRCLAPSTDGHRIAFLLLTTPRGSFLPQFDEELVVMNSDGSAKRRVPVGPVD